MFIIYVLIEEYQSCPAIKTVSHERSGGLKRACWQSHPNFKLLKPSSRVSLCIPNVKRRRWGVWIWDYYADRVYNPTWARDPTPNQRHSIILGRPTAKFWLSSISKLGPLPVIDVKWGARHSTWSNTEFGFNFNKTGNHQSLWKCNSQRMVL